MDDDDQLTAAEQAALDSQRGAPEPEAPPQTAPEVPQEDAEEQEAPEEAEPPAEAGKRPQMVPHAALHQERTRRQELERQAAEDRRKYEARFEELLRLVPQPQAQTETPQAPAVPDVQADPVGHIVGTLQQLGASQDQIKQAVAQQQAQQQLQQQVAAVQARTSAMAAAYRAEHPEFDDAREFLKQMRDRQLIANGMLDPSQRALQLDADEFQIAVGALQQGGNPAERLHRIAEASGWAKPVAPSEINDAPAAMSDQAARLRTVQQGQEQSRGLGNARGNGPAPLTGQKLLDMPEDDYEAIIKIMKTSAARKLMGA